MQIVEHRSLFFCNLISYKTHLEREKLPEFAEHVKRNISRLGVEASDNMLFTVKSGEFRNIEVLIPISEELKSCNEYSFKPVFRLINAVCIRHEGTFGSIEETLGTLFDYINSRAYEPITAPYYSIVRLGTECIIDIYVGTNYNIL
ncbi:hypothetical protein [Ruminococcus sp. XPD3002]|uniref:hypothetical protein n=1 Tax=Ruminococcus sp. XPD3002 TaxID=1452269 RepID=UPI00091795C6|nr:hypothetical protein [Ruminococcus sp.]SFX73254.1 hypothetical protein SAMN04487832_11063 [Ruminococcus flavefaciens]HPY83538.1 hypothetical protein [Ruminococcus flavefaciens]HRU96862.1 hypothetical protein [Ruminococcus sp.]